MTLVALVIGLWLALSLVTAAVFFALVRGGGGTAAWTGPVEPEVAVPEAAVPEVAVPGLPAQRAGVEVTAGRVG